MKYKYLHVHCIEWYCLLQTFIWQQFLNNICSVFFQLNHPNIVKFFDSFIDGESFCIVTEYCEVSGIFASLVWLKLSKLYCERLFYFLFPFFSRITPLYKPIDFREFCRKMTVNKEAETAQMLFIGLSPSGLLFQMHNISFPSSSMHRKQNLEKEVLTFTFHFLSFNFVAPFFFLSQAFIKLHFSGKKEGS